MKLRTTLLMILVFSVLDVFATPIISLPAYFGKTAARDSSVRQEADFFSVDRRDDERQKARRNVREEYENIRLLFIKQFKENRRQQDIRRRNHNRYRNNV